MLQNDELSFKDIGLFFLGWGVAIIASFSFGSLPIFLFLRILFPEGAISASDAIFFSNIAGGVVALVLALAYLNDYWQKMRFRQGNTKVKDIRSSKWVLITFRYLVALRKDSHPLWWNRKNRLSFPEQCSICGDLNVEGYLTMENNLSIFSSLGKVPYCKAHYLWEKSLHEHKAYMILPALVVGCTVVFIAFWLNLSLHSMEGLIYLTVLPLGIFFRYFANRQFRKIIGLEVDDEFIISSSTRSFYLMAIICIVSVLVILYGNDIQSLLAQILVTMVFLYWVIKELKTPKVVEEMIKRKPSQAIKVVSVFPAYYFVGIDNAAFYEEFSKLNHDKIVR
ncbi:MAG: hypothetical protein HQ525_09430 [Anaerolineae bacterium]|nr:hypothetical protein [Anaerolineae bacterium]